MSDQPSPPVSNGRQPGGQFGPGNKFARGNPNLRRVHQLRSRLLGAVDEDAFERIGKRLVELAEAGDLDAIKVLFAYTIGKPPAALALTDADGESLTGYAQLKAAILQALEPFGDKARFAVALALSGVPDADPDGE